MFLVLARCLMDDVPLRLCSCREEAVAYAASLTRRAIDMECVRLDGETHELCALVVVDFVGGVPQSYGVVRVSDDVPDKVEA